MKHFGEEKNLSFRHKVPDETGMADETFLDPSSRRRMKHFWRQHQFSKPKQSHFVTGMPDEPFMGFTGGRFVLVQGELDISSARRGFFRHKGVLDCHLVSRKAPDPFKFL